MTYLKILPAVFRFEIDDHVVPVQRGQAGARALAYVETGLHSRTEGDTPTRLLADFPHGTDRGHHLRETAMSDENLQNPT
jgi:hypothetical protein